MRIYYDVIGTNPTLGKVTAGIVLGVQTSGVTTSRAAAPAPSSGGEKGLT